MSESKPVAQNTYSPGLAGIIAGESAICWVDPNAGLRYRGYDVEELADKCPFESVAWLLLHNDLPSATELGEFTSQLNSAARLPEPVMQAIELLPANSRSMDALRTGISMLASFDPDIGKVDEASNQRKAVRLIARMTTLASASWRITHGQSIVMAGEDIALPARFLRQLNDRAPEDWQIRALNIMLILYAEHEFNASTFAARVTCSTLADMYSGVVSAIGTLEGPLHGGANEEAMKMLRDIGSADRAGDWVKERLSKKEKIMGFGHRVYKTGDSRVPVTRRVLAEMGVKTGQTQWLDICQKLESVMEKEKGLFANLDLYAAPILYLLGLPAELNTPLFACGRIAGWCAHIIEQQANNRLIRPRCLYTGPKPRSVK